MKTKIYFLFLLILLSLIFSNFTNANNTQTPSREEIIDLYQNAVVKIERWEIGINQGSWSGSGVFYTPTKLITNAHVVGNLTDEFDDLEFHSDADLKRAIFWVISGGKKYKARVVGRDPQVDLAILETEQKIPNVVPAPLGNSNEIKIGDDVLAIGNPYGLKNTVTKGIISAKERITGLLSFENYLQTDAPINPGNSGGPLVSLKDGKVIGLINSGIRFADGMGFAVPINLFHTIEKDLRGTIKRSWLGINFPIEINETEGFQGLLDIYQLTGINNPEILKKIIEELFKNKGGVLINDIAEIITVSQFEKYTLKQTDSVTGSPAKIAGLIIGDIIQKLGQYEIKNSRDLLYAIFMTKPLQETEITIIRFEETNSKEIEKTELTLTIKPLIRLPSRIRDNAY